MALENQVEQLQNELQNANAERLALDQMLVENLKNALNTKKEMIILNQKLANLNQELKTANSEVSGLKEEIGRFYLLNKNVNEQNN